MTTLVTGGSGVVGREIVRLLVDQGRRVRCLARSETSSRVVRDLGAEPVAGDVLDYRSLIEAVRGADVVYHVAGVNSMCVRSIEPMRRTNVDGTRNVIRAAGAGGVRRVVYTSSAVTLGERRGTVGDETTEHRGWFLSKYERTKFEAEQVALGERVGVEIVVVNPSSVQGPGRITGTGRLLLAIASGRVPFLIDTTFSIVDITDAARGHLLAEANGVPGRRYVLSGFSITTRDAVELLHEVSGRRVRVGKVPVGVLTLAGWIAQTTRPNPSFCVEMARVLAFGHTYDGSRATRDLGLIYTNARETLTRTVAWFRETGHLQGRGR